MIYPFTATGLPGPQFPAYSSNFSAPGERPQRLFREIAKVTQRWQTATFNELSIGELYEILRLRQEVFAVEQTSIYVDPDGLDQAAKHISLWEDNSLLAYQRCLPPGLQETESTLGRILVASNARGRDLGRELVRRGIEHNLQTWAGVNIRIHAQAYLEKFYSDLGFVTEGDVYGLDGIPHLDMVLTAPVKT